jgi:hypothetical protein
MPDHVNPFDALEAAMGSASFSDVMAEACESILLGSNELPEYHKVEVRVLRHIRLLRRKLYNCMRAYTSKSMENKGIAEENADTRRALLKCLETMETDLDDFMAVYPALTETTNENTNDKGE